MPRLIGQDSRVKWPDCLFVIKFATMVLILVQFVLYAKLIKNLNNDVTETDPTFVWLQEKFDEIVTHTLVDSQILINLISALLFITFVMELWSIAKEIQLLVGFFGSFYGVVIGLTVVTFAKPTILCCLMVAIFIGYVALFIGIHMKRVQRQNAYVLDEV